MFKTPTKLSAVSAPALLVAALSWALLSAAGAQTAGNQAPSTQESGVDASIRPGDDFFAYANGGWLKANDIPAGKQSWGARNEITELTRQRVEKLLADAGAAPRGSSARQVADFYAAYMNEAAIEAKGIAALKPMLGRIDRVRDKAALTRLLGLGLRADVDPLNAGIFDSSHVLGLAVQASIDGEKTNRAFLLQGGLGLPDREQYIDNPAGSEPRMQALRTQYEQYIGRMLALAGFDHAAQRAQAVMALETAIAQTHTTAEASNNDRNADNLWTRADFARQAPGMDWSAFFAAAGLARQQEFVAWQPGALKGAAALLASQPLQAWKDYLRFHVVHHHADVLPRAFAEQASALRGAAAAGPPQPGARAQRAIDATQAALRDAVGRMYVERYFPAEHKARVQAIVANVINAFIQRVEAVPWMSPATRALAQAKLKTLYSGIGYPEKWQDYSGLVVDPADAVGNLRRVAERNYRQAVARIGQSTNPSAWTIAAQWPGAVLFFHQNSYNFAAALLQPPKFDPAGSDAANYGAIGAIIGHEVSHFIDTLGADYEADGRMRRWWTPEDMSGYQASTEALVNQFSGYQVFADLSVNGKLTLTENLADLAGLASAFDAYRRTLGNRASDKDYVRQQDQLFFIGFAQAWRSKSRDAAIRTQIASDSHAPDRYRIATVRNIDAWYDAFDVQPGQRLYLEPKARVRVW